ncbi:MAG: hypothetical protein ACJ73S_31030 [Mycobacteriales bacterium]
MRRAVVWASALAVAGTAMTTVTVRGPAAATTTTPPGQPAPITLVTGDQVIPRHGKGATIRHAVPDGPGRSFRMLSAGTHRYAYPVTASPYLGRVLDPALFDLNTLTPDGSLKVHLTYRPGASDHDVPGVTVTSQTAGGADGYLTPESATRFGAALASQYVADQRARDFGGHGIFAGVSAIRPATTAAPPVRPHYPMYTLSLTVLDQTGQPMPAGPIAVVNVDDARKFDTIGSVYRGVARFSVPAGHYMISTEADTVDPATGGITASMAAIPQLTVTGNQSLTVDARTATSHVAVPAPAGTSLDDMTADYQRNDATGAIVLASVYVGSPGDQLWTSPTQPVTTGTFYYFTEWWFSGPGTAYSAIFPSDGSIPADQSRPIDLADMASIDTGYASDRPNSPVMSNLVGWPKGILETFSPDLPVPAPGRRTEYITGGHDIPWARDIALGGTPDRPEGFLGGGWRHYQPGEHLTENWGVPLRHPQYERDTGDGPDGYYVPAATRRGDTMVLWMSPFGDSDPTHAGNVVGAGRAVWSLYAGDQLVGTDDVGYVYGKMAVPADQENYRLVLDTDRDFDWWRLSTHTHTEWRFPSAHQSGGSLPAGWQCDWDTRDGSGPTDCAVLPLLWPDYSLAGVGLDGHAPAGPSTLGLTVAPPEGAAAETVTAVTVEVSYDDGQTWTPATVTGSGSQFTATYTTPDPAGTDGYVSVRTTATDAAGDSVTQTLIRAYALGS